MGSLTVRKLDEGVKTKLRVRAAHHGRSLEEEVRQILAEAANETEVSSENLADAFARIFGPMGGVDLNLPPRTFHNRSLRLDE